MIIKTSQVMEYEPRFRTFDVDLESPATMMALEKDHAEVLLHWQSNIQTMRRQKKFSLELAFLGSMNEEELAVIDGHIRKVERSALKCRQDGDGESKMDAVDLRTKMENYKKRLIQHQEDYVKGLERRWEAHQMEQLVEAGAQDALERSSSQTKGKDKQGTSDKAVNQVAERADVPFEIPMRLK